ncbi:imidazole glycerol phosphate synthase subunit HisH [uncultured Rikenella sp.]|uniref:imidazole glycerol phosphate synthase subunit HisH n=1 Tax=uncultured Rikenella sp. TaxID=368003 RepID=UPI00263299C1|nr:imidazole glycerol phosphate synthase subunit HisH [uncultured Rikenella sp.]
MVTIIDYGTGNLRSVINAFERLGTDYLLTSDPVAIQNAERVLLPGVGEAATAMAQLRDKGLTDLLRHLKCPVLGICLGMQLLCAYSEEGETECLGVFPNRVRRFPADAGVKVPHVGWNSIHDLKSPLYKDIKEGEYVYYVHSYAAEINECTAAATDYGGWFSGSLYKDNFYGCQFHPEKSGAVGGRILANFLTL